MKEIGYLDISGDVAGNSRALRGHTGELPAAPDL